MTAQLDAAPENRIRAEDLKGFNLRKLPRRTPDPNVQTFNTPEAALPMGAGAWPDVRILDVYAPRPVWKVETLTAGVCLGGAYLAEVGIHYVTGPAEYRAKLDALVRTDAEWSRLEAVISEREERIRKAVDASPRNDKGLPTAKEADPLHWPHPFVTLYERGQAIESILRFVEEVPGVSTKADANPVIRHQLWARDERDLGNATLAQLVADAVARSLRAEREAKGRP